MLDDGCVLTIESKPSKPNETSSNTNKERVVRLEMNNLGSLARSVFTDPWSEHKTPCQSTESTRDMYGSGAGKVVHAQVV